VGDVPLDRLVRVRISWAFQWDWLLLEAGFIAIFFAPPRLLLWKRTAGTLARDPLADLWLLFRLMFSAGAVKLLSGDPTWRDLSAMRYHYFTQPIPAVEQLVHAPAPAGVSLRRDAVHVLSPSCSSRS
jgi:hypothetical protein